ncbi:uncharacterized protein METZ01_LOCUS66802, partial [marine metagenome]
VTSIRKAIDTLLSSEFQSSLTNLSNPYGKGGVARKIVNVLKTCCLKGIVRKGFFDVTPSYMHSEDKMVD